MKKFLFLLSTVYCLLLPACGFEPVYGIHKGTPVGVEETLGNISIGNIPDREGQMLRNALIDRFYRTGRPEYPRYDLEVGHLNEQVSDLDVTKTADATRGRLRMSTTITLRDSATNEVLLKRSLQTITSYNILASEFATRVTEEDARGNAINDLARQIELQLTLYFRR